MLYMFKMFILKLFISDFYKLHPETFDVINDTFMKCFCNFLNVFLLLLFPLIWLAISRLSAIFRTYENPSNLPFGEKRTFKRVARVPCVRSRVSVRYPGIIGPRITMFRDKCGPEKVDHLIKFRWTLAVLCLCTLIENFILFLLTQSMKSLAHATCVYGELGRIWTTHPF